MEYNVCDRCKFYQLTGDTKHPRKCLAGQNDALQKWWKETSVDKKEIHDLGCFKSK